MKYPYYRVGLFLVIASISALATDFALQVTDQSLFVFNPAGEKIAEVTPGTVGKQITVGSSQFLLSFGRDVRNHFSAIISPLIDKSSPLTFTTLNKAVRTDGNAIVTIQYSSNLASAEIDAGFIGRVQVADIVSSQSSIETSALKSATQKESKAEPAPASLDSLDREMANQGAVSQTTPGNKDAFTLLEKEGVIGFLNGKNAAYALKDKPVEKGALDRLNPLSSTSIQDPGQSKPMGKISALNPETLAIASQDKTGEVRLVNIQGSVAVNGEMAKEGELISSNAIISTGEKASAVAIVGGLHVVTIHPHSEASISQSLSEKTMLTVVNLRSGNVFADVNKRPEIRQDFQIVTAVGVTSATGSQALVGFNGGKLIVAAFESAWKGKDASGKESFNMRPLVTTGGDHVKAASFGSIPSMGGAELQREIGNITSLVGENVASHSSRIANVVNHPVASFVQGNASTLPDGSTNPGATIEGKLRSLFASIMTDGFEPEKKDDGFDFSIQAIGGGALFADFFPQFENGRNGQVQPVETTPGGR